MTAPVAVASWPIPPAASSEWRRLTAALEDREPPCSTDPSMWFSRQPDEIEAACHRCLSCPAFTACDSYAVAANEATGVWGGVDRNPGSNRQQQGRGRVRTLAPRRPDNSPHSGITTYSAETNRPMKGTP